MSEPHRDPMNIVWAIVIGVLGIGGMIGGLIALVVLVAFPVIRYIVIGVLVALTVGVISAVIIRSRWKKSPKYAEARLKKIERTREKVAHRKNKEINKLIKILETSDDKFKIKTTLYKIFEYKHDSKNAWPVMLNMALQKRKGFREIIFGFLYEIDKNWFLNSLFEYYSTLVEVDAKEDIIALFFNLNWIVFRKPDMFSLIIKEQYTADGKFKSQLMDYLTQIDENLVINFFIWSKKNKGKILADSIYDTLNQMDKYSEELLPHYKEFILESKNEKFRSIVFYRFQTIISIETLNVLVDLFTKLYNLNDKRACLEVIITLTQEDRLSLTQRKKISEAFIASNESYISDLHSQIKQDKELVSFLSYYDRFLELTEFQVVQKVKPKQSSYGFYDYEQEKAKPIEVMELEQKYGISELYDGTIESAEIIIIEHCTKPVHLELILQFFEEHYAEENGGLFLNTMFEIIRNHDLDVFPYLFDVWSKITYDEDIYTIIDFINERHPFKDNKSNVSKFKEITEWKPKEIQKIIKDFVLWVKNIQLSEIAYEYFDDEGQDNSDYLWVKPFDAQVSFFTGFVGTYFRSFISAGMVDTAESLIQKYDISYENDGMRFLLDTHFLTMLFITEFLYEDEDPIKIKKLKDFSKERSKELKIVLAKLEDDDIKTLQTYFVDLGKEKTKTILLDILDVDLTKAQMKKLYDLLVKNIMTPRILKISRSEDSDLYDKLYLRREGEILHYQRKLNN
ncbi:MAG: hypothetical protein ACTSO7_07865 [Candidatus Heimdallarchaeota archaeon]